MLVRTTRMGTTVSVAPKASMATPFKEPGRIASLVPVQREELVLRYPETQTVPSVLNVPLEEQVNRRIGNSATTYYEYVPTRRYFRPA